MLRSKKFWALVVGAILLAMPPPAKADITLEISTYGGATFTPFSSATGVVTGVKLAGTAVITVTATSNQPTASPFGEVSQVQVNINTGAVAQAIDLVVRISDHGFVNPSGNAVLSSSWSGTTGAHNTVGKDGTFQSAVDYSNTLFGGLPGVGTLGPTFLTPSQPVVVPTIAAGSAFLPGSTVTAAASGTPPYALSNEFSLTHLSLGGGSSLELTGITTLSAVVPAPSGLVLALTGLPLLGWCYVRRRWLK